MKLLEEQADYMVEYVWAWVQWVHVWMCVHACTCTFGGHLCCEMVAFCSSWIVWLPVE